MSRRVVAVAALVLATFSCGEAAARHVVPGGQEGVLRRMLRPSEPELRRGWTLAGIEARESEVVARYGGREGRPDFTAVLRHPDAAPADALRTARFALSVEPEGAPELSAAREALAGQIRAAESEFAWKEVGAPPSSAPAAAAPVATPPVGEVSERLARRSAPPRSTDWARRVALALLGLCALALPLLGRAARDGLRLLGSAERLVVLVASVVALVVRLLAPHRMVMVFMGYPLVHDAVGLERLPKYGSAVPALHHVALGALPLDYATVLYLHGVLGALTVPLAALFLRRYGARPGAAGVASVLLALLPLLVKDHNSESYLVPALFWLFSGLLLVQSALARRSGLDLAAAGVSLTLACLSRPLLMGLVPLITLASVWGQTGSLRPLLRLRAFAPLAVCAALLVVPNAVHVLAAARAQAAEGALPGLSGLEPLRVLGWLVTDNLVFRPRFVPSLLPLLAVVAVVLAPRGGRRAPLVPWAVAVLWWALYFIDLPPVSRPRLQAPGVLLVTLVAASGAVDVVSALRARWGRGAARAAGAAIGLLLTAGAAFTIPALWQRGNADEEADFFAEAVAALPSEPVVFVRLGEGDQPRWGVHRAYPDDLPLVRRRGDMVLDISDYLAMELGGRPTYFYEGVRCYAASSEAPNAPTPTSDFLHPLCAEILRARRAIPVLERAIPNHSRVDFRWYPTDRDTLSLRLYRLEGRP